MPLSKKLFFPLDFFILVDILFLSLIMQLHNTLHSRTVVYTYTYLLPPSEEAKVILSIEVMACFSAKANVTVTHFLNGLSVYLELKCASW